MKKNIIKAIIVILISIIPASSLFAQKANGQRRMQQGKKMMEQLNLTPDQKDQIDKLRFDNQKKAIDLRSDIAKTRLEMKEELKQKDPNENKVIDLSKKVSDLQAQMKANAISTWFKSYRLLDDKQKETFKKMAPMLMERGKRGMRNGGQKGMGRGPMNG